MTETSKQERIRLSGRVRHRDVVGEGVLVHLDTGRVLVVSEVGLFIVQELGRRAMTVDEMAESVMREFEIDEASALADLTEFLDQLREEQAVEPRETLHPGSTVG